MPTTAPWPLMPPKSTELRMEHFDGDVYVADSTTLLYKFLDAICGDAGAGALKKQIFIARLSGALDNIYFSDLDYIFGNVHFLSRTSSESYSFDPMVDMLTAEQWDEVKVKDAWYRNRIKDFFIACQKGGTFEGVRMAVQSAISCDCDLFEVWRYFDNFGLGSYIGRAPSSARNELVVRPHKSELTPKEFRLLRDMLDKITPQSTIITISTTGLSVSSPIDVRSVTADSSYYEVEKTVTPSPVLDDLPPPELLAIDLLPSEQWMLKGSPETAPYAAFNITQEYGYYYLASGGKRSPIDSVEYGTLQPDGSVVTEPPLEIYETTGQYEAWREYERADSPDNFPGGKFGLHPSTAPALNADQSPYVFPWESQAAFVASEKARILAVGGIADDARYRLPIQKQSQTKRVYRAELAIAYNPPAKDSTITTSWTGRRPRTVSHEIRATSIFVRS